MYAYTRHLINNTINEHHTHTDIINYHHYYYYYY